MEYKKVEEQIRNLIVKARDYICANDDEFKEYEIQLNERYYFCVFVGIEHLGYKYIRTNLFSKGFDHLSTHMNPFALNGEYLEAIITAHCKCFEQIEKEK